MASAVSRSSARMTDSTGPKISSRATRIDGSTRSSTLGPIKKPPCARRGRAAVEDDVGPLVLADVDVAGHAVEMLARDDRPHVDIGTAIGRADFHAACGSAQSRSTSGSATLPTGTAMLPAMQRSPAQPKAES